MDNTTKINKFIDDSIELLNDYQEIANNFKMVIVKTALCSDAPDFSDFYNKFIIRDLTKFSKIFKIHVSVQIACDNDKKLLKKVNKLKNHADKLIKKFDTLKKKYKYMFAA